MDGKKASDDLGGLPPALEFSLLPSGLIAEDAASAAGALDYSHALAVAYRK